MTANIDELRRLNEELQEIALKVLPEEVNLVVRKVSMQVLEGVVKETPVDTGRARGAWTVTEGLPSESVPPEREGHILEKKAETAVAQATIDAGTRVINSSKAGGKVWVVNNVPYIEELEAGSSRQSPPGAMVEKTLDRVRSQFE